MGDVSHFEILILWSSSGINQVYSFHSVNKVAWLKIASKCFPSRSLITFTYIELWNFRQQKILNTSFENYRKYIGIFTNKNHCDAEFTSKKCKKKLGSWLCVLYVTACTCGYVYLLVYVSMYLCLCLWFWFWPWVHICLWCVVFVCLILWSWV